MTNNFKDINPATYKALLDSDLEGPVQMINLLKFKDKVEGKNKSGKEQYDEYMKAAYPFFKESKAKIIYDGVAQWALIGPEEKEWDKILIIEYASKTNFITMITKEGYPAEMRKAALENSRLILSKSK